MTMQPKRSCSLTLAVLTCSEDTGSLPNHHFWESTMWHLTDEFHVEGQALANVFPKRWLRTSLCGNEDLRGVGWREDAIDAARHVLGLNNPRLLLRDPQPARQRVQRVIHQHCIDPTIWARQLHRSTRHSQSCLLPLGKGVFIPLSLRRAKRLQKDCNSVCTPPLSCCCQSLCCT